jgi:tetratricopeptide (TPR) repeat protein
MDKALENFQCALTVERQLQEKRDPTTVAKTLNEIGNVYLAQGETPETMKAFTEAARLYRSAGLSMSSVSVSLVLKLYAAGFETGAPAA